MGCVGRRTEHPALFWSGPRGMWSKGAGTDMEESLLIIILPPIACCQEQDAQGRDTRKKLEVHRLTYWWTRKLATVDVDLALPQRPCPPSTRLDEMSWYNRPPNPFSRHVRHATCSVHMKENERTVHRRLVAQQATGPLRLGAKVDGPARVTQRVDNLTSQPAQTPLCW